MTAPDAKLDDVPMYDVTPRARTASVVSAIVAVLLIVGLIGTIATTGDRHSAFDLASKETLFGVKVYRPGAGFLVGPVVILGLLAPLLLRTSQGKGTYLGLMTLSTLMWAVGLVVTLAGLSALSWDDYTIEPGMWVALSLLAAGQLANLAMWPFGTRAVSEPERSALPRTPAAAPRPPAG